jgi:arginine N-succinyltransferase
MLFIRPVLETDQEELLRLANEAGIGMTSLPPDEDVLHKKIMNSVTSCNMKADPEDEYFLFVMVDTEANKLVGTAGIDAHVGIKKPFYSYKLSRIVQASEEIDTYTHNQVLHMVNDYTRATEIGSLFLLPDYRKDGNGRFMSRFRYLMLAQFPEMFSDVVISEIRGVQDDKGQSPFYQNLAEHFFQMPFRDADFHHATKGGQFISDLMPRYPIYVKLLNKAAQDVIGVPFEASRPAMRLLEKEGFRYQGYVDVFDAGPTMQVERSAIRSVRKSRCKPVRVVSSLPEEGGPCMVASTSLPRLAGVRGNACFEDGQMVITTEMAELLDVKTGDKVRYLDMNV